MGETDRVRVPTNGHRPALGAVEPDGTSGPPADDAPTPPDYRVAVTPAQLAAGFGVLAGLILLLLGTRRRRRDAGDDRDA
jgi:MYXO-CTERM domain-containing protein